MSAPAIRCPSCFSSTIRCHTWLNRSWIECARCPHTGPIVEHDYDAVLSRTQREALIPEEWYAKPKKNDPSGE